MITKIIFLQTAAVRNFLRAVLITTLLLLVSMWGVPSVNAHKDRHDNRHKDRHFQTLSGTVEGNGSPQFGYKVSLYTNEAGGKSDGRVLGTTTTDDDGKFTIHYRASKDHQLVYFVFAEDGPVMLASAIGSGSRVSKNVVVNELTTVATGAAFAQFIDGRKIRGNTYGMLNAVKMVENMANPQTGDLGNVLDTKPNADENSTRATFNSMANMVANCVDLDNNCDRLFENTTPPGGPVPTTVLQAVANMTKYPSNNFSDLFTLSGENVTYAPVLPIDTKVNSWLLFIKFTGQQSSAYDASNLLNGPGNIAFDERGFAWINDNYVPTADLEVACAGLRLLKFYPWGESFPRSPYFGGGLSGAGFGITLDPRGRIWVGNFGFEAPLGQCVPPLAEAAPHDSVSVFRPNGTPFFGSPFTKGFIWWPQATVSDKKGNIWVANCGNDTVTVIPKGKPRWARNVALPGGRGEAGNYTPSTPSQKDQPPDSDAPVLKPFGIAIDPKGRAWVTGNQVGYVGTDNVPIGRVYRISLDGTVETLSNQDSNSPPNPVLSWPMGISGDSKGNMWVSNSDSVKVPCVDPLDPQDGNEPSIALYPADDSPPSKFIGGGLTIPWGNAVDGNDTLWVFNFGQKPTNVVDADTEWPDTPLSHFCGVDTSKCPSGKNVGAAISPPLGYVSDALDRITGGNIDPSGNVWLMNNWKKTGPYEQVYDTSPGGNSFVIVPGAAGPVKTPLIGPPQSFDDHGHRKGHHRRRD